MPSFAATTHAARELQADYLAEEMLEIADDGRNDWTKREDGIDAVNAEVVQRSRLRVDARKWLMAKLQPKKYGDRIAQEVTGGDGLPLVPVLTSPSIGGARRLPLRRGRTRPACAFPSFGISVATARAPARVLLTQRRQLRRTRAG
jgi:hypothetical protein